MASHTVLVISITSCECVMRKHATACLHCDIYKLITDNELPSPCYKFIHDVTHVKPLLMGVFYIYIKLEILSVCTEARHDTCLIKMQTTCGKGLRPVDRYMMYMYTDIDFECHSQLLTTIYRTVN